MAGVEIVGRNGWDEENKAFFHKNYQNDNRTTEPV
jgi:hypothetical protein